MKETVDSYRFCDIMATPINGFSYSGAEKLFDILLEYEQDTGIEFELDPIAFRCQFTEYDDFSSFFHEFSDYIISHSDFSLETYNEISDDDEKEEYLKEKIEQTDLLFWQFENRITKESGIIVDVESI